MDVVLLLMAWGRNTILIKNAVTCGNTSHHKWGQSWAEAGRVDAQGARLCRAFEHRPLRMFKSVVLGSWAAMRRRHRCGYSTDRISARVANKNCLRELWHHTAETVVDNS